MPYPRDLLDKVVQYRVDPGVTMNPTLRTRMVDGVLPGQTVSETVSVRNEGAWGVFKQKVSGNAPLPWTFTFLRYVGGAVTTASLRAPVLTGPMSGCYLFRYQRTVPMVAHVGTANSGDSEATVGVKRAWRAFAALPNVTQVEGGDPFECFSFEELRAATPNPSCLAVVCGYFTPAGQAYAILLSPVPKSVPPLLKVAQVKPMTLRPWASLSALPKFMG